MPFLSCFGRFHFSAPANLRLSLAVVIIVGCVLAGCEAKPQITSYTVPKEATVDTAATKSSLASAENAEPKQTLGAIFVRGDTGWFFKAMDDPAKLGPITAEVRKFIESVRFPAEGSEPTWTLPEGWSREAGNQFRFATIRAGSDKSAPEISVSQLPGPQGGDESGFVLSNVNRWRDQVGLSAIDKDQLEKETETIKAGELSGVWISVTGKAAAGGSMMAPFAGGAGGSRPPFAPPSSPAESTAAAGSGIKYETPEGWQAEPASGFRKASFKVKDGEELLDISVSDLAAQAGELLPNINRWRQQVKLPEVTQEELDKQLQPIKFGEVEGHMVELVGEAQDGSGKETILGAIAVHGNQAWFVKARGTAVLAEREKQRFEQFVRSIQFE